MHDYTRSRVLSVVKLKSIYFHPLKGTRPIHLDVLGALAVEVLAPSVEGLVDPVGPRSGDAVLIQEDLELGGSHCLLLLQEVGNL